MNVNLTLEGIVGGAMAIILSLLGFLLRRTIKRIESDIEETRKEVNSQGKIIAILEQDSDRIDKMTQKFENTDHAISRVETQLATLVNESKHTVESYNKINGKLDKLFDIIQVNLVQTSNQKIEIDSIKDLLNKK